MKKNCSFSVRDEDRVVWCVCELARRAVAAGCQTFEVKLATDDASTLRLTCQDDCPSGIFSEIEDRALVACRTIEGRVRITTAAADSSEWQVMDLEGDEFSVERRKRGPKDGGAGATRVEASVFALSREEVDGAERRIARFLARLVLSASSPLKVCLARDGEVAARLGTQCFTSRIVAQSVEIKDDRMQRALVAYGKSIVEGPTDATCATAADSKSRITVAKFPRGSLFRAREGRILVEVIRIVDGEPLVDGFGSCALTQMILTFDDWPSSRRAKFSGDKPFLRFSLERDADKKRNRGEDDEPCRMGDILIALEVEATSETLLSRGKTNSSSSLPRQIAEYCPECDTKGLHVLLRSCLRKIFSEKDTRHHLPEAIKRALDEMATNSKDPSFSQQVRSKLEVLKLV